MPDYQKIPTSEQWRQDCSRGLEEAQTPFPGEEQAEAMLRQDHVLGTINDLLSDLDSIREAPKEERAFRKHQTVVYLHEATNHWLNKGDRAPKTNLGGDTGGPRFTRFQPEAISGAVKALHDVSRTKLLKYYDWVQPDDLSGIRQAIADRGVGVRNTEAELDEKRRQEKGMVWLESDDDRFGYKLRFRKGRAYRIRREDQGRDDVNVEPFSTNYEESELGDRKTHFVMDSRGRIYCGYDRQRAKSFKFFSSLVAGEPALSAGMMQIENGQIRLIANASGHYRPDGRHMAAVLQRLRMYGVPMSNLAVEQYDTRKQFSPDDVLRWNGWPKD